MSDLTELEHRMSLALERLQRGVEVMVEARSAAISPETLEKAEAELLQERAKSLSLTQSLHAKEQSEERLQVQLDAQSGAMEELDSALKTLRAANEALEQSNSDLRAIAETEVADAEMINRSLKAEIETLRADRQAERAEVKSVLAALEQLVEPDKPTESGRDTQEGGHA